MRRKRPDPLVWVVTIIIAIIITAICWQVYASEVAGVRLRTGGEGS